MFGKVKTIVLPGNVTSDKRVFTIDEYKEAFGIDFRELLVLKDSQIDLNPKVFKNTEIFIECATQTGAILLAPVLPEVVNAHNPGDADAITELSFFTPNQNFGGTLRFYISKDKTFDISNLEVQIIEI